MSVHRVILTPILVHAAPVLSSYTIVALTYALLVVFNEWQKCNFIVTPSDETRNLASSEEMATTVCILDLHSTGPLAKSSTACHFVVVTCVV